MAVGPGDVQALANHHADALDDTKVLVKAGQTLVYGWHIKNDNAAQQYLQIFDAAAIADVTLGTTKPDLSIGVEGNDQSPLILPMPIPFALGIVIAGTTDNENSAAGDLNVELFYAPK